MNFPYDGKSSLSSSADATLTQLQTAHLQVEDLLLGMVRPDSAVKLIARFDSNLKGHLGQSGTGVGAVRYWSGKFDGSKGVLVEQDGDNLLPNPSAEVDLTGWSANDPALVLSRDTSVAYTQNGTVSVASFKMAGTGDAGPGYIKSSLAVSADTDYSAAVYVYSAVAAKAKLELAFSGGTPVSHDSGEVSVPAGTWTRLKIAEESSGTGNTTCEIRVYLVQEAPAFSSGSRLSYRTPTATAAVTDSSMSISAGDVAMCAVTANPSEPKQYAFHMVTTSTNGGVAGSAMRLDGSSAAPTFVPGSRFSKWAPAGGDAVTTADNALVLAEGDLVFCSLESTNQYDFHLVTTGATGVSSADLRLDGSPLAPEFDGSRFTRFVPTDADDVDSSMTLAAGDLVFCYPIANPATEGYGWHIVTTAYTGAPSTPGSDLRLDGQLQAPTFAAGSFISQLAPTDTDLVTDPDQTTLTAGDFAFCYPTKNPAESGYGWHMITTGATGVSSSSLRLDQTSSGTLYADCALLSQQGPGSFIDSFQGSGFTGALGSSTSRASTRVSFPASGALGASAGTVAFWLYPMWDGDDGSFHVLFDAAVSAGRNRIMFAKNIEDKLVLSVYDDNGEIKQVVSSSGMTFSAETWQHMAFTWSSGTLKIYHDGVEVATSGVGSGTGQLTSLPASMFVGTDYTGDSIGGAVFDDLVVKDAGAGAGEIRQMAAGNRPYSGLAMAQSNFAVAAGRDTTHSSAGTQTSVPHGLGATPSMVLVTERGNGIVYLSAEADSTNFYVKGSANSVDFDWRAIL